MSRQGSGNNERPSVLFAAAISPNKIGGVEAFAAELARQLDSEGWNLTICFHDSPPQLVKDFLRAPGNVSLTSMHGQFGLGLSSAIGFFRLARRLRPRVLLYSLGGAVRWWPLLGRFIGVRRSVYYDGSSRTNQTISYRASIPIRILMSPLCASVCASRFVKTCSDREGIVPPHKSRVIYNAVDNSSDLGDGAAFRKRYGIPEGRIIVLKISWLVPEKGIDLALRAAKRALQERRDLQFVFCGDGVCRNQYQKLADELGIAEYVTWTGQIESLARSGAFRAAEIQIQCSQWHEAFCLAVAEGMSAGLPIVASQIGGLPELVEDGFNGILFKPESDLELANAILVLARDKKLRSEFGARGRERALQNHDLEQNVRDWVDVLLR